MHTCSAVNVSADSTSKFHKQFSREALLITDQLGEKQVGGLLITFLSGFENNSVSVGLNVYSPG